MISGVILAAGESSRMASPKALLKIRNETFAECILRKMQEANITNVTIVTGAHHQEIESALKGKPMAFVYNSQYKGGQITSLKEGLRHLQTDATLIWPVDQPLVKAETVKRIIAEFESNQRSLTIPVYNGRHGHPIICDQRAIQAVLNLPPDQTAKELQKMFADSISFPEVDDPGVTRDIDTPEDYRAFIK